MKQVKRNRNHLRCNGTSTFHRLPACDCLREEKSNRCTLPPSLFAMQRNACLQIQALVYILLVSSGFSSPFSKGRPRGILRNPSTRKISPDPSLEKRGENYNANGTKKSFTYPNGMAVDYTYDANNQLTGVNIPYAGNISYNAYQWTRPTAVTLPSSSGTKAYAYDELMRARTILSKDPSQNPVMNYQYTYDKMDNIQTRNTQTGNYAYTYDNLYRLSEVKKDEAPTEAYTYDPVGNRQTSMQATDWTHNANNELLSLTGSSGQSGAAAYQYDANGNTIQRTINGTIQNFVYDVDNRLIEVRDASNALIAKYTYDPFGRRIKKEIPSPLAGEGQGEGGVSPSGGGQGEEVFYHYADEGLIGEYDNTGNQTRIYGYKPNSTWSTDPLFLREGGNIYFYHNDHLGTPQKMTNISGATVWSATYDAFGKATIDGASTVVSHLRFPGQYFDAETGLHYNYHRFYVPNTGRYVTSDPIGFEGGDENLYRYVRNNPVTWTDSWGLRIQIMGDQVQKKYILDQLNKFVRGKLSIDENGFLKRPPCKGDEGIESDIDELIKSGKLYRIFAHLYPEGYGRSQTVPTNSGADIYFDPNVSANYRSGIFSVSASTPAGELAHELLGRGTQIERGVEHGRPGSDIRRQSNERSVDLANRAYERMGMPRRTAY